MQSSRKKFIVLAALAVVAGIAAFWFLRLGKSQNPELATPRLALEALSAHVLYFNGPARPWLIAQRPDLLAAEDRDANSDRSRAFTQAVLATKLFRQLDRRYHFDTLLLVGDPSQYR